MSRDPNDPNQWLPDNKDDWELPDEYFEYQEKQIADEEYQIPENVEEANLARPDQLQYRMATEDEVYQVAMLDETTAAQAFANAQLAVDQNKSVLVVNGIGFDPQYLAQVRDYINKQREQEEKMRAAQQGVQSNLSSNL